jgi:hypothetical protein
VAFRLRCIALVQIDRVSWTLYVAGSLLVFFSWMDLVPAGFGWFGWLMAMAGWAVGNRPRQSAPRSYVDEIQKIEKITR